MPYDCALIRILFNFTAGVCYLHCCVVLLGYASLNLQVLLSTFIQYIYQGGWEL